MGNKYYRHLLWAGTCLLTMVATAGYAQAVKTDNGAIAPDKAPAANSGESGPGDIVVTARRVEERLQDVPISITVFNQQQITNRNIVNAQDLAAYTPSLSSNTNFGSQNSTFAIRGFVQDYGTQPSVGVYFADVVAPRGASPGIPIGDGAGPGSFFDLQNVQVLKGPQGTLFGRNTTGGAILIVPQKPTDKYEGYVEGSFGDYGMKRGQAVINIPLGDTARFRLGVDHESRDGYLKNDSGVGPTRFGDVNYVAVRASLVVDLTPDLENYTIASYLRSDNTGYAQKVIACNPNPAASNVLGQAACAQLASEQARGAGFYGIENDSPNPNTLLTQWQIINTTTWRASDHLTLKNIVSYAQLTEDYTSPIFGTRFDLHNTTLGGILQLPVGSYATFSNANPYPGLHSADQNTLTEEFQIQGKWPSLSWQAGAYLERSDPLGLVGSTSSVLVNCINVATFNCTAPLGAVGQGTVSRTSAETRYRNYGLYAQATYDLTDHLKLTGGVRYTWDRVRTESTGKRYAIPSPGNPKFIACNNPAADPATCTIMYATGSQKPTWLIDLDYKPTGNVLLYAKYTRGYRAGGITSGAPVDFAIFKPEKVDSYEIGVKTSANGPLHPTLDVAAFYNNFQDQQLQVNLNPKVLGTVPAATAIQNAGKSTIYGAEFEGSVRPFAGLTLNASYTYLHTKIDQIDVLQAPANSPYFVDTVIVAGDALSLSPKNKVSATATYMLPLPASAGALSVGATFTHIDSQIANYVSPYGVLAPRDLLNLNLNWNSVFGLPLDASLFATNVTNKKYYTYVSGLYNSAGFETAQLGEPRMYGARIRIRFGQ